MKTFPPMAFKLVLACTLALLVPYSSHGQTSTQRQPEPMVLAAMKASDEYSSKEEEPRNLITNGDFEKGMSGWLVRAWAKTGTATVDEDERHEDHPSLRIDNPEADNTFVHQLVVLEPGTRYRLSVWVKTKRIEVKQGTGEAGATVWIEPGWQATRFRKEAEDWTCVKLTFDSGTKTDADIGPRLGQWGGILTGTAWYTQLTLVKLPPGAGEQNPGPSAPGPWFPRHPWPPHHGF